MPKKQRSAPNRHFFQHQPPEPHLAVTSRRGDHRTLPGRHRLRNGAGLGRAGRHGAALRQRLGWNVDVSVVQVQWMSVGFFMVCAGSSEGFFAPSSVGSMNVG